MDTISIDELLACVCEDGRHACSIIIVSDATVAGLPADSSMTDNVQAAFVLRSSILQIVNSGLHAQQLYGRLCKEQNFSSCSSFSSRPSHHKFLQKIKGIDG